MRLRHPVKCRCESDHLPDAGAATAGNTVRYPDALVTFARARRSDHLAPNAVVVFDVLSSTSRRAHRIEKLLEYRAVPTIRRYAIVEHGSIGMTVHARSNVDDPWTAAALTADDVLAMPEIGIDVPFAAFREGTGVPGIVSGKAEAVSTASAPPGTAVTPRSDRVPCVRSPGCRTR